MLSFETVAHVLHLVSCYFLHLALSRLLQLLLLVLLIGQDWWLLYFVKDSFEVLTTLLLTHFPLGRWPLARFRPFFRGLDHRG